MRVGGRLWVLAIAGALVIAGCGGDAQPAAEENPTTIAATTPATIVTTSAPTSTTEPLPTTTVRTGPWVGEATPIDPFVEVRLGGAEFSELAEIVPVSAGDRVRTGPTGYAQLLYPDGSVTRLDVDTDFEVVELAEEAGAASTRTVLHTGRVWNRVTELASDEEFVVETSVATATVRGTELVVTCPFREEWMGQECTFVLIAGVVDLDLPDGQSVTLVAPQWARVNEYEFEPEVAPLAYEGAFTDEWVLDNDERDTTLGFVSAVASFPGGPTQSPTGTFVGDITVEELVCPISGRCPQNPKVGTSHSVQYWITFEGCDLAYPCPLILRNPQVAAGPYSWGYRLDPKNEGLSASTGWIFTGDWCGGAVESEERVTWSITPLATELRPDGTTVVTELRLRQVAESDARLMGEASGQGQCESDLAPEVQYTAVSAGVLRRVD